MQVKPWERDKQKHEKLQFELWATQSTFWFFSVCARTSKTRPQVSICWAIVWIPVWWPTKEQHRAHGCWMQILQLIQLCQGFLLDKQKRKHHGGGPPSRGLMDGGGSIWHWEDPVYPGSIAWHHTNSTARIPGWLPTRAQPPHLHDWTTNNNNKQSIEAYSQPVLNFPRLETKMRFWLLAIWVQEIFFCKFWYKNHKGRTVHSLRNTNLFHSPIRGVKGTMKAMLKIQQEQKYSNRVWRSYRKSYYWINLLYCAEINLLCVCSLRLRVTDKNKRGRI